EYLFTTSTIAVVTKDIINKIAIFQQNIQIIKLGINGCNPFIGQTSRNHLCGGAVLFDLSA
ncbi:MAG: hypothetical protein ACRDL7_15640, partial [Gaiellaceae bacterium]